MTVDVLQACAVHLELLLEVAEAPFHHVEPVACMVMDGTDDFCFYAVLMQQTLRGSGPASCVHAREVSRHHHEHNDIC